MKWAWLRRRRRVVVVGAALVIAAASVTTVLIRSGTKDDKGPKPIVVVFDER